MCPDELRREGAERTRFLVHFFPERQMYNFHVSEPVHVSLNVWLQICDTFSLSLS